MSSLFRKFFGTSSDEAKDDKQEDVKSPYAPDISTPVDEQFTMQFINNGGKFIYCENLKEVSDNFENILAENDWYEKEALCFDQRLFKFLEENKLSPHGTIDKASFLLIGCENLIASEGSILFSSNQLKHYKPDELPTNMIVFATTSQLVAEKGDGMTRIKNARQDGYPTNITTIKYFEEVKEKDFLHYGSCHKNLYLLLLEDL
ncbi:lactate utilization protein B/C [Flavobacterium ardleyense]|uniref:Lactate utilization protein B/C n=1 Tax=Flavobacterium ardleyense TaxID=2038737 RepID=A0ABW5Z6J5_9FLAO